MFIKDFIRVPFLNVINLFNRVVKLKTVYKKGHVKSKQSKKIENTVDSH